MSDLSMTEHDPNESPNVRQMRERIKNLEEQAKAAGDANERADRLERELAVRDAGIELDSLQRKALFAVHEGEFTAEGIRDTAVKLGFSPAAPVEPEVPAEELARLQRIASASAGAPPAGTPVNADTDLAARLAAAKSEQEFDAIYRTSGRPMIR